MFKSRHKQKQTDSISIEVSSHYEVLNGRNYISHSKNGAQKPKPKMQFLESAFNCIINTIGSRKAESGGLLFGNETDFIIRKFVFDKGAKTTGASYTFDTEFLNPEIKRLWNEEGLSCLGFIHSHPFGYSKPSPPDMSYFTGMFEQMPREKYLVPIVFTIPDGGFKINAHILPKDTKEIISTQIEILPDDYLEESIEQNGFIEGPTEKNNRTRVEIMVRGLAVAIISFASAWPTIKIINYYIGAGK